jgi:hypothetical protein
MNKSQMSLSLSFCFSALSTVPPRESAPLGQPLARQPVGSHPIFFLTYILTFWQSTCGSGHSEPVPLDDDQDGKCKFCRYHRVPTYKDD